MRGRVPLLLAAAGIRIRWVIAWFAASARDVRPLPWRRLVGLAVPLWLITRLLSLVVTYLSQTILVARAAQSPFRGPITLTSMINSWRLWDGGFYGGIAQHGYTQPIDAAFWPFYPLLARPLVLAMGNDHWQFALLIVSNLATLAAFILIGALAVQEDRTIGAANRAMRILAATPLALFLTAAYSDSLFLALVTATLLCARRGAWRAAIVWAFLAALSRPLGAILIAPMLWEYGSQLDWRNLRWQSLWRRVPMLALLAAPVPLAVELFSFYCGRVYGDALAWMHAQSLFGHAAMAPWSAIGYAWQQFWQLPAAGFQQSRVLVDVVPLAFVGLVSLVTIRRIPVSFSFYLMGLVLTCLSSPIVDAIFPEAFVSVGRYLLAAIPLYLVVARWMRRYPWLDTLLIGGGFVVQALLMAFVLTGGWLV
jgi:mannosyltransferase PIG-V